MAQIFPGRFTAQAEEPVVVFLIGMRINRLRAVGKWLSVAREMPPMMKTLLSHPEKGLLGAESFIRWREVMAIQYWRSFEDLERFAKSRDEPHAAAWQRFMKRVGSDGTVGIWHETFVVQPGGIEAFYGNMPRVGLAAATNHVPVGRGQNGARARLEGHSRPGGESRESEPAGAAAT